MVCIQFAVGFTLCCLMKNRRRISHLIQPREKIISSKFKVISCCRHSSVYLFSTEAPSWTVAHPAHCKTLLPSGTMPSRPVALRQHGRIFHGKLLCQTLMVRSVLKARSNSEEKHDMPHFVCVPASFRPFFSMLFTARMLLGGSCKEERVLCSPVRAQLGMEHVPH